ncbi:Protein of unknown function [Tenacibaculum sp. MAR_2009_124]|uniref:DUF3179 domain-containing protein n=1 Tax=Tenacibaculum sp. MAR_2009_124 TaxID=1250059 RepID=UPI00089C18CA|nr:DUF3179 domain-containing protein [Tenacibaculum sp. MAR_2009_124]SED07953.1 Protein of unknown function [Tenacibaculum sp. MAR_2009_124]
MKSKFILIVIVLFIISCSGGDSSEMDNSNQNGGNSNTTSSWLIPKDEVIDGGSGKDGIPSINSPVFYGANQAVYLLNEDLIIGIVKNGEVKAYPHRILDWHEVVNDEVGGDKIVISYCPLTGTALGWNRNIEGRELSFGVSGLLYNTNLILYDRQTDSNWSQLEEKCVNGEFIGETPENINLIETTWELWKKEYPNTLVLSDEQGLNRHYDFYPYGPYKEDHDFFVFPIPNLDTRLPSKERIHVLKIENQVKTFRFSDFNGGKVVKKSILGRDVLIVGNENIIQTFILNDEQKDLIFEMNDSTDSFFQDNEDNRWSINGRAISGNRSGDKFEDTNSYMSFWFAVPAFHSNVDIINLQ